MTGAPGSGKTSILRALENLGYAVVLGGLRVRAGTGQAGIH